MDSLGSSVLENMDRFEIKLTMALVNFELKILALVCSINFAMSHSFVMTLQLSTQEGKHFVILFTKYINLKQQS